MENRVNADTRVARRAALGATLLVVFSLLLAAVAINFSAVQRFHDSDSVLLAFISIDHWTPFYWGDNRYGMLVPLLASWIHDYRWNLLFQIQILALAAVAGPVVANAFFLQRERGFSGRNLAISALSIVLALAALRPDKDMARAHLLGHPYHISLALLLGSVALVLRGPSNRRVLHYSLALMLMAASLWINPSNLPLAVGLFVLLPGSQSWLLRIAAAGSSVVLYGAVRWWASGYPSLGGFRVITDVGLFIASLRNMTANTVTRILSPWVFGCLVLFAAIVLIRRSRPDARHTFSVADASIFVVLATAFAVSIALTDWPARNQFEPRYWTVPVVLVLMVVSSLVATAIFDGACAALGQQTAVVVSGLLLLTVTLQVFGLPSRDRAMNALDEGTSMWWPDSQALGCTHMLGNYAVAWSTVFRARSHGAGPQHAVTPRAEVIRDEWDAIPNAQRRYCGLCGDPSNAFMQGSFGLGDLRQTGSRGPLCRFEK